MENEVLDFSEILSNCGLGTMPSAQVAKNIANLEEFYDSSDLVNIYNYCLTHIDDAEILLQVIKYTDAHRSISTMNILLDMLLLKPESKSEDELELLVNVRALCAKAISNYKDHSTVSSLLYCLNNKKEHYKVRLACADALGRIGDRYAVKPLIDVVEDENEKSVYLKESAAFALGLLGDTSAIDPLIAILDSKQGFLDKFAFLKEKIVEALGKLNINNKKVIKALKKSLMDPSPMVRINAIEAIMNSEIEEFGLDLNMLLITDIVNSNSQVIVLGNKANITERAYGVTLVNNTALLKGVVSRKKQVIPVMTENV